MVAVIVATHGDFSREIVKSAELFFGPQENVTAISFRLGEGLDKLTDKYQQALKELDTENGVLFLVDLFGGSPFNVAANLIAAEERMDMVTGVNLPMLIECFALRGRSELAALVDAISQTAVEGVKSLKKTLQNCEKEEEDL